MARFEPGEIVVEIDHPKNSNVEFHPTSMSLRSRILPSRFGNAIKPWMLKYEQKGIPGQRIHLDVEKRCGRIVDGLSDDPALMDQINRDIQTSEIRTAAYAIAKEDRRENLSDIDVQTWLFWMRRLVDKHYRTAEDRKDLGAIARCIHGTLPKLDDIVATGKVLRPYKDNFGKAQGMYYGQKEEKEQRQTARAGNK